MSSTRSGSRPRRTHAQARAEMRAGIIREGNAQLRDKGAAGLSVREIARGLGVVSSALYRHVKNRDELLTLLVVDAYDDLANFALAAADGAAGSAGPEGLARLEGAAGEDAAWVGTASEFRALVLAVREWAVRNPERWALLYGSPVPGYAAPAETTTVPGLRVMRRFAIILLSRATGFELLETESPSPGYGAELVSGFRDLLLGGAEGESRRPRGDVDPLSAAAALQAWTGFTGLVSAEIFGQLGPVLSAHGAEAMELWVAEQVWRFGLA